MLNIFSYAKGTYIFDWMLSRMLYFACELPFFYTSPTLIAISALQRDNLGHVTEITKKILHFIRLTLPLQGLTRMCIVI
jgi:hypothetical protein